MSIIGIISDTHGLLRHEAKKLLKGVELIIHAGDVGSGDVLEELSAIGSLKAVRGNVDNGVYAGVLPASEYISIAGKNIYVIHNIDHLDIVPEAAGVDIVIYGHSHKAQKKEKNGVLYFNPGSIGPRRFNLPVSMGLISISEGVINAEIIEL